jgi:hypothetical protein
VKKNSEAGNA